MKTSSAPADMYTVEAYPTVGILNLAIALERMGGDRELLEEIAQLFLATAPGMLLRIREAIEAGDAYQLERAAHALKGSVSNFAAESVVQAALRLEEMGRSTDLSSVEACYQALLREMERLRPALAELAG